MLSMVKRNTETVCVVGVIVEQERGREGTGKKGHCHWVTVLLQMLWRPAGPLLLNWKEIVQKTLEPSLPHHHHHHQRRHYHHYCLGCFKCLSKVASGTGTGTWRICCIFAWLWTFASGKSNGMWQLWPPHDIMWKTCSKLEYNLNWRSSYMENSVEVKRQTRKASRERV